MERLDKWLAGAAGLTRSQARDAIRAGRVTQGGQTLRQADAKVDGTGLCLDGAPLADRRRRIVLLLNKPEGYVTSTDDPRDRTVMELLPPAYRGLGLAPVGRLDKNTEGLLLLTNDGGLAHRLISPRSRVEKAYYARHEGQAGPEDVAAFQAGITLRDGALCRPAVLEPLGPGESRVILTEGKYHQVRRMMASRGLPVTYLERVREGNLTLEGLPRGQCRELTPEEAEGLEPGSPGNFHKA